MHTGGTRGRGRKERPRSDVGVGEWGRGGLKLRPSPLLVRNPGPHTLPVLRTGRQLSLARLWGADGNPIPSGGFSSLGQDMPVPSAPDSPLFLTVETT